MDPLEGKNMIRVPSMGATTMAHKRILDHVTQPSLGILESTAHLRGNARNQVLSAESRMGSVYMSHLERPPILALFLGYQIVQEK